MFSGIPSLESVELFLIFVAGTKSSKKFPASCCQAFERLRPQRRPFRIGNILYVVPLERIQDAHLESITLNVEPTYRFVGAILGLGQSLSRVDRSCTSMGTNNPHEG